VSDAIVPLDHQLLTADEVAELLRLPVSTIYDLARTGRLPHMKIGRALRFSRSDLEAHLAERCRAQNHGSGLRQRVASAARPSRARLRGSLRSVLTGRA
jgi:excisionase family DNA binding protein